MSGLLILGAGVAGISCAFHAKDSGHNALILEAQSSPGGLLDNYEVDGFRFDKAVHLSFSQDPYVRNLFDTVPHYVHSPDAWCYEAPLWLKHPVQNNLFPLPIEDKVSLLKSFFARPEISPKNYSEWLCHQYGEEISKRYPLQYTQKYWALNGEKLGLEWIGNRMRRASADEILRGAMSPDTGNGYYAQEMRYPRKGGYFSFVKPMLNGLPILLNKQVKRVDIIKRVVTCADNSEYNYDILINTIPLTEFIEMIPDVPMAIINLARSLWATRVDLLSVGISKPEALTKLWFYLYDKKYFPARAYSPSQKSSSNVPQGCSSIQFEIYSDPRSNDLPHGDILKEHAVKILGEMDIASKSEILFVDHRTLPFGNVVFDIGMEKRRNIVRDYLRSKGVVLAGRFGEWEYFWSDQALLSGKRAAFYSVERLASGQ